MISGTELNLSGRQTRKLVRHSALVAMALAGAVSSCECDKGFKQILPEIVVDPNPIVFDTALVGKASEIVVTVSNKKGLSTLKFSAPPEVIMDTPTEQPVFAVADLFKTSCTGVDRGENTTTIEKGECATLKLRYRPVDLANNNAKLRFKTNAKTTVLDVPIVAVASTNVISVCVDNNGTELCNEPGQPLNVTFTDLIAIGATGSKSLKLRSAGTKAVEIASMVVTGDVDFTTNPTAASFTSMNLDPSMEWPFTVSVTPVSGGLRTAKVLFTTSDPLNPNLVANITVTGDGPGLCWCIGSATQRCVPTTTADFGNVTVGTMGSMYLDMSSCGTKPLVFVKQAMPSDAPVSITMGGDVFSASGLPPANTSVEPGAAAIHVPLSFLPPMLQSYSGKLEINTNVQNGTINLLGNGTMGGCSLSAPMLIDMGSVQSGQTGTKQLAVSNRGTEPCTFPTAPVITVGANVKFSISSFPTNAIGPGGTAQFTVAYQPQDLNSPDTGEMTIYYLGQSEPTTATPHTLAVALKGTPVAMAQCKLKANPSQAGIFGAQLNFGQVQIGTESILPITFTNIGSSNCTVKNARLITPVFPPIPSSGAFKVRSIPQTTINPGQSFVVDVSFKPTSDTDYGSPIGSIGGEIVAVDTSDSVTFTGMSCGTFPPGAAGCAGWGLAGQGVRSPLQVLPPNLDFGQVTLGCNSSDRTVTLYNIGSAAINITELKVDPMSTPPIFTPSYPPLPIRIAGGSHVDITVRYTPPDAMPHTASLFVKSDATANSSNPYVTVSLRGSGTTNAHQTDTFLQAAQPKTDVLFVIDNSGSMAEEQSHLADNARQFTGIADTLHSDYHIAVVTTDVETAAESGNFQGTPKIITPSTNASTQFASRVRALGTNGSGTERPLDAMYMALSDPLINDPMANGGFLRDDAKLAVVVVTDEDDQSRPSVDYFYDFLINIKGPYNASLVSFNAIAGDNPSGCTSSDGDAVAAARPISLQQRTAGKFRSICSGNWGAIASDLGLDLFAARAGFTLTRVPDVATIVVHVNGNLIDPSKYTFNSRANAVVFNPNALPAAGASIVIDYDAHCF